MGKQLVIDIAKLYRDHGIDFVTEGHKHCQPGWVQTPCPYCAGNPGYHLGYEETTGRFNCWRCGFHPTTEVLATLLHVDTRHAYEVALRYARRPSEARSAKSSKILRTEIKMPMGTGPLGSVHRHYLERRRFDPDYLAKTFDLRGTGPVGHYRYRIIAPIFLRKQMVSYQGRDITNKSDMKYKACPKDLEVVHHKHTLYAIDLVPGSSVVVCEGITDVWRLGPGAVATFGIKYKMQQVRLLAKAFKRAFVLFDTDDVRGIAESHKKARSLADALAALGMEVEVVELDDGDPGELPEKEAKALMRELLG